jgi:hypothetical protein|tara:strand:+ start:123 stop:746 length:624 start_codon:yes stop_codon:yes gene_type:complete
MSNLQSLLKKLSAAPASAMSYVYYDKETGKIHKISSRNVAEDGFEIFEIETLEVKPILTGERRTDEFIIMYDVSLKQIRLKEVAYDDSYNTAATMCYQLPVINCNITLDTDIVIQQDTKNNVWNLQINPHTKKFLRMSMYNTKETICFSITSKYDPNILYRSLEFLIGELITEDVPTIPFKFASESIPTDVSIYTAKYFDSYAHEII